MGARGGADQDAGLLVSACAPLSWRTNNSCPTMCGRLWRHAQLKRKGLLEWRRTTTLR
jgi:hypothetical protein